MTFPRFIFVNNEEESQQKIKQENLYNVLSFPYSLIHKKREGITKRFCRLLPYFYTNAGMVTDEKFKKMNEKIQPPSTMYNIKLM